MIHHSQKLEHSLLTSGIAQSGVVDYQVGVDLPVVAPDEEPFGSRVVLLNNLDPRHESLNADLVVGVLGQKQLSRQLNLCGLSAEIA